MAFKLHNWFRNTTKYIHSQYILMSVIPIATKKWMNLVSKIRWCVCDISLLQYDNHCYKTNTIECYGWFLFIFRVDDVVSPEIVVHDFTIMITSFDIKMSQHDKKSAFLTWLTKDL